MNFGDSIKFKQTTSALITFADGTQEVIEDMDKDWTKKPFRRVKFWVKFYVKQAKNWIVNRGE